MIRENGVLRLWEGPWHENKCETELEHFDVDKEGDHAKVTDRYPKSIGIRMLCGTMMCLFVSE